MRERERGGRREEAGRRGDNKKEKFQLISSELYTLASSGVRIKCRGSSDTDFGKV